MSHSLYHCSTCKKALTTESALVPMCCSAGMLFERTLFHGSRPNEVAFALIERFDGDPFAAPASVFEKPPWWRDSWEVWVLRNGRQDGERIGWLGLEAPRSTILTAEDRVERWHFQMTPGVKTRSGTRDTQPEAVSAMHHAIEAS